MNLSERFKQARLKAGLTQDDIAQAANISQPAIKKIESGETKNPSRIIPIAKILNVTAEWLLYGSESLQQPAPSDNVKSYRYPQVSETIKIPVIKMDSLLKYRDRDLKMDEVKEYIYLHDRSLSNCVSVVVDNDEMTSSDFENSFRRGEYLLIDFNCNHKINDFVIANLKNSGDIIFKQFIKHADKYYLKSLNPQYPLVEINDNIEIIGVIVSKYNLTKFRH